MHEMGVVINMLHTLEKTAKRNNIDHIKLVKIDLGEMTGVVPHYLRGIWPEATHGTICERSELVVNIVRGLAHCADCGSDYLIMENLQAEIPTCPQCKSSRWVIKEGDRLIIKEIGVEE